MKPFGTSNFNALNLEYSELIHAPPYRTEWAGRSLVVAEKRHPAYDHLDAKAWAEGEDMNQPGDPIKGAKAMYDLAVLKDLPLRVVLGTDAYKLIMRKVDEYSENCKKYEKILNSTDVDE
ncbi:MAG: hypothetical protein Q9224_005564 [Gallowayella concinna]